MFRRLVLKTVDAQDNRKDKGIIGNMDYSTRIEPNRLVFRRLVLATVGL